MDDFEPFVGGVYNMCDDFFDDGGVSIPPTTSTMLVLRLTDESMLTRSTTATLRTRSIQQSFHVPVVAIQFFRVLTTCSDVQSTYHLEFQFGYFALVAWSCDYVWIADESALVLWWFNQVGLVLR